MRILGGLLVSGLGRPVVAARCCLSNVSLGAVTPHPRCLDSSAVFVVSGASRGIGLETVKQLLKRTQGKVVAGCREPSAAAALMDIGKETDRVELVQLDVTDQNSLSAAAEHVKASYGRVDELFNVAGTFSGTFSSEPRFFGKLLLVCLSFLAAALSGILGDGKSTPGPERSLKQVDKDWAMRTMDVNALGPVMVTQAFQDLLRSKGKEGRPNSIVASLSARVGSISDNRMGGWISYRMSKAALNQATKCMGLELKRLGIHVIAYHPGTTRTDLSAPFAANVKPEKLFSTEFTVSRLLDICDGVTDEHTGGFYDFDGLEIMP